MGKKKRRTGRSDRSDEDREVEERRRLPQLSPPVMTGNESETSSQGTEEYRKRAHTTSSASLRPALKSRHSQKGTADCEDRSVSFAPDDRIASETVITSYRSLNEELWFDNPQTSVMCERCRKRVTQKQGQLRGGPGNSSFMCDEFVCADCVASE